MKQVITPNLGDDAQDEIAVLAVVSTRQSADIEHILSHTRWQTHVVHSIHEAIQSLQSLPISVVLCEDRLSDGTWLDVVRETEHLCPRPQTIVLSTVADAAIWGEVLNCGGYDLLPTPLEPREVYPVVAMAWRQSNNDAKRIHRGAAGLAKVNYAVL
jgi:DNA-binding NtrC family response regulator